MDFYKFNRWLNESKDKRRNFFILIGPPAVGKSSWVRKHIDKDRVIISKDNIIEKTIFPKYGLTNKHIFKSPSDDLNVGDEHPEYKQLGKVKLYKRFSKSKGQEVEEKEFENAYAAGQELDQIYKSKIEDAINSNVKNIVVDAIHMRKSTRSITIDFVRGKPEFKIIGVVFPHKGYEKQIYNSAEARAKDFLDRYGSDFDRSVSWDEYQDIYAAYQQPSMSEGFDELEPVESRFNKRDIEIGLEDPLSEYWKKRAEARSKNARRNPGNYLDLEWAKLQQEKSRKINSKIFKIFEREIENFDMVSEEIDELLVKINNKREMYKKKMQEKKAAKLKSPKKLGNRKTLPNPYSDSKVTKKYPFSKDRTGGVAKVYKKRSKKSGGPTIAPGESFGPAE